MCSIMGYCGPVFDLEAFQAGFQRIFQRPLGQLVIAGHHRVKTQTSSAQAQQFFPHSGGIGAFPFH